MSNHRALNMFGRSGNPAFGNKFSQQGSFVGTDACLLYTSDAAEKAHV